MTTSPGPEAVRSRWSLLAEFLARPYPLHARIVVPAVVLMALVPGYLVIAALTVHRTLHMPELALDRVIPVVPMWSLVYLSLYLFWLLPLVVIWQEEQISRTFMAYIAVWVAAYLCFLIYPTTLPRPSSGVIGEGFSAWMLRIVYDADPPYNCFPCLHVAHPVVSALSCYRVNRGVGLAAGLWTALLAVSTLYTKQHYVADVVAGALLGGVVGLLFLRHVPRRSIPQLNGRLAGTIIWAFVGIHALTVTGFWIAYQLR